MKTAHSVTIRVFCSQEEDESGIVNGLKSLVPLDFEEEKITIQVQKALGFNEKQITIFEIMLAKNKHIDAFLNGFLPRISDTDRQMLLRQLESRVDDEGNFFVRVEKEQLAKMNEVLVTDSGNCYHIRIKMAVYPSTKESAIKVVKGLLSSQNQKQYN